MRKRYTVIALALGAVLVLGALGIGAVFAAAQPTTPAGYHGVFVGKVAKILGIDEQKVSEAFTQARGEMLDDAVAAGRMTAEQADWMKQHMQQGGFVPGFGPGAMHGPGFGRGFGPGPMHGPGFGPGQPAPAR